MKLTRSLIMCFMSYVKNMSRTLEQKHVNCFLKKKNVNVTTTCTLALEIRYNSRLWWNHVLDDAHTSPLSSA